MTRTQAQRRKQDEFIWTIAFACGQLDAAHGCFSTSAIVDLLGHQGVTVAPKDVDAVLFTFAQPKEKPEALVTLQ